MKSKAWLWVIGVILIVGIAGSAIYFSGTPQTILPGYSVLGLSQVNVINDGILGKSWKLVISTMPDAEQVRGVVQQQDIDSFNPGDEAPETDVVITMDFNSKLKYKISDTSQGLYYYFTNYKICSCPFIGTPQACSDAVYDPDRVSALYTLKPNPILHPGTCKSYYVIKDEFGSVGNLPTQAPDVRATAVIYTTAGGEYGEKTASATIDTFTSHSANLLHNGQTLGRVSWAGNLVNGVNPPAMYNTFKPINLGSSWYVVRKDDYDYYKTYVDLDTSNLNNCLSLFFGPYGTKWWDTLNDEEVNDAFESCIADPNLRYDVLRYPKNSEWSGLETIQTENGPDGISGIYASAAPPNNLIYEYPVLTMILDVDWLGIAILHTEPDIGTLTPGSCASGTPGVLTAEVTNDGDDGTMQIKLVCDNLEVVTPQQDVPFLAGQTNYVTFEYDTNSAVVVTETCTVVAEDKGDPSIKDTKTVSLTCDPTTVCVKDKWTCFDLTNDGIKDAAQCNSQGTQLNLRETCTTDERCVLKDNEATCEGTQPPPPSGCKEACDEKYSTLQFVARQTCYIKCEIQEFWDNYKWYVIGVLGTIAVIIIGLVVLMFAGVFKAGKKTSKKNKKRGK